jgi:uncharacterized protein (DUF58 family)
VEASQKYLNPRMLAKLSGLELRARRIVEGYVSGAHRSPFHGFSIEFAEHREYAPGDDLRYVDWKVYARTDHIYLKQYEDETNLVSYVVLDGSESMQYKGPDAALSKMEYAQCIAASLSWLVLHQQDAVGIATFDDQVRALVNPANNASQLKQILHAIDGCEGREKTDMGRIFHELAERLKKRGVVLILSDLFDDIDAMLAGLRHFHHRRHDVIVFHILDPAELDFPFNRLTMFEGMESMPQLLADPRALKKAYLAEFERYRKRLQQACRSHQIDYQLIRTDQPLDVALSSYLAARMARVK